MNNSTKILEALSAESLGLTRNPNTSELNTKSYTVALLEAVTQYIYKELVQINNTETLLANVFCWENRNPNGDLIVNSSATYSGMFGVEERELLKTNGGVFPTKKDYTKGDFFLDENTDVVYQAVIDNPFTGITEPTDEELISSTLMTGNIRYVSDGSVVEGGVPSDSSFNLRAWRGAVTTRKTKIDITTEAMQDLRNILDKDSAKEVIDAIAMIISEDINKDIIHKLICISQRFKSARYDDKVILDLSTDDRDDYIIGRELYSAIGDMISHVTTTTKFTPNYVVVSPRVAGKINSSGMSEIDTKNTSDDIVDRYMLNSGTTMIVDSTAKFDYIMVGISKRNASALYMSNYVSKVNFKNEDHDDSETINVGTYNIFKVVNPNSMSDSYMCQSRYALTSPPYTYKGDTEDDEKEKIVDGDDWANMATNSPLSLFLGVKLPPVDMKKLK